MASIKNKIKSNCNNFYHKGSKAYLSPCDDCKYAKACKVNAWEGKLKPLKDIEGLEVK
jgi:hypothetical protein